MSPALIAALITAALAALQTAAGLRWQIHWTPEPRAITPRFALKPSLLTASALSVAVAAAAAAAIGVTPAVGFATATWIGLFAVNHDWGSQKIPRELPILTGMIGTGLLISTWSLTAVIETVYGIALLVIAPTIARRLTRNGLGRADVNLLGAFALTLTWWTGADILAVALIAACLIQIPVHLVISIRRWRRVPRAPRTPRLALAFAPAITACLLAAATYATIVLAG